MSRVAEKKSKKFVIGDKVVYPGQGAAIVREISQKETFGGEANFYIMQLIAREATVMVPVANVQRVGLRAAVSETDLERLYRFLGDKPDRAYLRDWRAQERDYTNKINNGTLFELAKIVKALYLRSQEKGLTFRRRRMLDHAWEVMVSEIAVVEEITLPRASRRVKRKLDENGSGSKHN